MVVKCWAGRWPPMWEVAVCLAVAFGVCGGVFLCCPFSHEVSWMRSWILNLIGSFYEGCPSYSYVSKWKLLTNF